MNLCNHRPENAGGVLNPISHLSAPPASTPSLDHLRGQSGDSVSAASFMSTTWRITQATTADQEIVTSLIEDRAAWLRANKKTAQWQIPWPNSHGRDHRIRHGLERGATWIAWDDGWPAATVTIHLEGNPDLWTEVERKTEAVYLHRLVVHQMHQGRGIGAKLIDWAVKKGRKLNRHVESVRLDTWADNQELHAYYLNQGFTFRGIRPTPDRCPSCALFERSVQSALTSDHTSWLLETPTPG